MGPQNSGLREQMINMKLDPMKWILVLVLIVGGIIANNYYSQVAWSLRAAAGIVLLAVATGIVSQTNWGKKTWVFIKGARTELRKVTWPTRQETIQTTVVVFGMVVVTAILLWGLDSFFLWIVSILAGQRG